MHIEQSVSDLLRKIGCSSAAALCQPAAPEERHSKMQAWTCTVGQQLVTPQDVTFRPVWNFLKCDNTAKYLCMHNGRADPCVAALEASADKLDLTGMPGLVLPRLASAPARLLKWAEGSRLGWLAG